MDRINGKEAAMTSATGDAGLTLIELTMVGFLIGVITAVAWPAADRYAGRQRLSAEADRLEFALRTARQAALREGRTVTFDAAPVCRRLVPKPISLHFFSDGSSEP